MDWKNLVSQLEHAGLTQKQIAEACRCAQPYISQIKTGARKVPGYRIGTALVDLHREHCMQEQDSAAHGEAA